MAACDSNAGLLDTLRREQARLLSALLAPNTRHGYGCDWSVFERWCHGLGLNSLPATPETVALYVTARLVAKRKISTVAREVAAINHVHAREQLTSPITAAVREVLRGARRSRVETLEQARPLSIDQVRAISIALAAQDTPLAIRDRAIVLVGFASALRTANLTALKMADIEFTTEGSILHIHREKQDQEGRGRLIGIPHGKHPETCAVEALRSWIARRGAYAGPLFTRYNGSQANVPLQPERIGQILQASLRLIGQDSRGYSGHSLRAGLVTAAGEEGLGELMIAAQTGHHDMAILRRYFRRTDVFKANVCARLDL